MYLGAAQVPPGVPAGRALTKTEFLGLALAEHAIAPHDAVMVGDTCFDIAAGKAHALRTIAVRWGYGTEEELAGADEYVG
jgi:phosphoglycolate phosphatase